MNIKQSGKDKAASWEFLPEFDILLSYLDRKYWVELSKCYKRYRNQLERQVFEKLELGYWYYNIWRIYEILPETCKSKKISKLLESDLGCKLKLVKSVSLCSDMSQEFAAIFVKLLPNVKSLILYENCDNGCNWEQGIIATLSCMKHLEYVELGYIYEPREDYSIRKQIFPKSLKSLNIYFSKYIDYDNESIGIYDTIDFSYLNLYSLTIVSDRILQNLSFGMPNLREVAIPFYVNIHQLLKHF
jgi:hypothetical protein